MARNPRRRLAHDSHSTQRLLIGSDLNTTPAEATYQLLTAPERPLHHNMLREIEESRFVHSSVDGIGSSPRTQDPQIASGSSSSAPAENDKEDENPDLYERSVANTRSPNPSDGILVADELCQIARELLPEGARSAYGSSAWAGEDGETFQSRGGFEQLGEGLDALEGGAEPGYTCFTPLFKLTLGQFRHLIVFYPADNPAQTTCLSFLVSTPLSFQLSPIYFVPLALMSLEKVCRGRVLERVIMLLWAARLRGDAVGFRPYARQSTSGLARSCQIRDALYVPAYKPP